MAKIIFVSGPCGCGKSTFANAYAQHLLYTQKKTVYVIHGDDFHKGFIEPLGITPEPFDLVPWEDILSFNWNCMLTTAERALRLDVDVILDYIIEDELPRVQALAQRYQAALYYLVLTAEAETLTQRIRQRGDVELIERSLFLKQKLEAMPENQGHLLDNTHKNPKELAKTLDLEAFRVA